MEDVLIIGGGQAGLAAAYYLNQAGLRYQVLEAEQRIGDQWRKRWEGLQLFTPGRYNSLPGLPFPGPSYGLPAKDIVADYLEAYAKTFSLRISCGQAIATVSKAADSYWHVQSKTGKGYMARWLILAAGAYRTPMRPSFAERLPAHVQQLHSSELQDPGEWLGTSQKEVLVVGAGASGKQLAERLSHHHRVTLAGRDPGHLPRRFLGRDVYDYLYGLHVLPTRINSLAGRVLAKAPQGGEIRVGEAVDCMAKRCGVARVGRVVDITNEGVVLADGPQLPLPEAVVFATGYRNQYPFLTGTPLIDANHRPLHQLGRTQHQAHWLGLHLMRRVNSSLLGGVGRDAQEVVREVQRGLSGRSVKV